ncbi:hypothetical protein [Bifidobacterium miconisargentati]|uniref:hypothetical protein n=1 Tax=Bifidobacterium miconisargentati TaxID=2834437 RepID=UPI001BDC6098|nr:hypothetical protein [Bifidobacterium miconisargentati]MBW3091329.1 hypothetical protein [Bifidobacterium miconisargentati]
MSILDDIAASSSMFPMAGATTFQRIRAGQMPDSYNPQHMIDDWDHPEIIEFKGALSQSSSTRVPDYLTGSLQTTTICYITMPADTDVRIGDRITPGAGMFPHETKVAGYWTVAGFPSEDVNAFTGWKPTKEAMCKNVRG